MARSKFPGLFWVGNGIEILERFAYYGLYMGFQIFVTKAVLDGGLGWSKGQLGDVQSIFLFLSYGVPLVSGVLADRYGFRRMLLISYVLYLPGFLLLMLTRQYLLVVLVMSLIAIAAGIFKPLIAGTVRLTTDKSNITMGFGIFYLMVNIGAFFGPMTAGALRTINWNYAFLASAIAVLLMIIVTLLWYRNPIPVVSDPAQRPPLGRHIKEILPYLKDPKILIFILIFGVLIEIPFWAFFNLCPMFVDQYVRTDLLYQSFASVFGESVVDLFSTADKRIAGETLAHTALYIIIFQLVVTRTTERLRSVPTIAVGIFIMLLGCMGLWFSTGDLPGLMFLGTILFAFGEMSCMPRFEQYLISLLPREKTGLGGGLLRIPVAIGAGLSGFTITRLYGVLEADGQPQVIWLVLGGMLLAGFLAVYVYDRVFRDSG
jgi:POT family proton-dependent oligopeptide transporter